MQTHYPTHTVAHLSLVANFNWFSLQTKDSMPFLNAYHSFMRNEVTTLSHKWKTHHGKYASDRPSHSCWSVCFPEIGAEQWRSNRTWNNSQYENSHHNSPRRQTRMSSIWWRKLYWHWNIFILETYDRCSAMWAGTKWGNNKPVTNSVKSAPK